MTDGTPDPDTTLGYPQTERGIRSGETNDVDGFVEALLALSAGHDLDTTLRTILTSAISLADAKYGALGILGEGEELERFLYQGVDEATRARIGHQPRGRGIPGVLISDPKPLRLDALSRHEASAGFPDHHPPMRSSSESPSTSGARCSALST